MGTKWERKVNEMGTERVAAGDKLRENGVGNLKNGMKKRQVWGGRSGGGWKISEVICIGGRKMNEMGTKWERNGNGK